jgi:low affinity Fe/Cu permease
MAGEDENAGKRVKKVQPANAAAVTKPSAKKQANESRSASKPAGGKTKNAAKAKGGMAITEAPRDASTGNDGATARTSNCSESDDSGTVGKQDDGGKRSIFDVFSNAVSAGAGKPATFVAAVVLIVVWGVSGPFFGFSETWQLVVNTGTTIITFLMVFVLQNSQNRDSEAVQTKLDELILSSHAANEFVGIEKLDEKQLKRLSESLKRHSDRLGKKAEELSASG